MSSPFAAARRTRHSAPAILFALLLLLPRAAPADAATGTAAVWSWPVPAPHPIVRPFIAPLTEYGAGHRGIDVAAAPGATIMAPDDGVVFFAGTVVDRPVLSITHVDGLVSSYEPVGSTLPVGVVVHRGDPVGTLLPGHCASTTCLHFGVRLHGDYVSPLNYLGGIPRSVLLPTRPLVPRLSFLSSGADYPLSMTSRREAAQRLDIPLEMAERHGIPARMTEAELAALEADPPAWLVQSRSNRRSGRPVWVTLTCDICGYNEPARPKKWWPEFTYLSCSHHDIWDLPAPVAGLSRAEIDGVGASLVGVVDG